MISAHNSSALQRFLQSTTVLWWSASFYISLTIGFLVAMWVWDFQVIDELFRSHEILASVAELDETQKRVHILVTATLDVAYPFAYGIFQSGMAYRYLGWWGKFLAPLSLLCIPVDLVEGFSQVMILSGKTQFLDVKVFVTPIKLLLYLTGLGAALVAIVVAAFARRSGQDRLR